MSSKLSYYLWKARAAFVTLIGLVATVIAAMAGAVVVAIVIAVVTVIAALVVHMTIDRTNVRRLALND